MRNAQINPLFRPFINAIAPNTTITVICCVCGKFMHEKDGKGVSGVSHSYCATCLDGQYKKAGIERRVKE